MNLASASSVRTERIPTWCSFIPVSRSVYCCNWSSGHPSRLLRFSATKMLVLVRKISSFSFDVFHAWELISRHFRRSYLPVSPLAPHAIAVSVEPVPVRRRSRS